MNFIAMRLKFEEREKKNDDEKSDYTFCPRRRWAGNHTETVMIARGYETRSKQIKRMFNY